MKLNKLQSLSIAVCCLVSSLWSEVQSTEDDYDYSNQQSHYNPMDVSDLTELRRQQSAEIESNSKKKEKLNELGAEKKRTDNFVGHGYIGKPSQQEILKKNREAK